MMEFTDLKNSFFSRAFSFQLVANDEFGIYIFYFLFAFSYLLIAILYTVNSSELFHLSTLKEENVDGLCEPKFEWRNNGKE